MQNWLKAIARRGARKTLGHLAGLGRVRPAAWVGKLRLEQLESRQLLAAYYVSPSGNDSNNGTSPSAPWKTIGRVNTADLNPGDSVNFLGGATFSGSTPLIFQSSDAGTAAQPVVITSYGGGRATISMTGNQNAVDGQHTGGFRISNINFVGSGWANNSKSGIWFHTWSSGALQYLHIDNVSITGFGAYGITVQASHAGSTFRDVEVTHSDLSGNKIGGFETVGPGANGADHSARTIIGVYLAYLRVLNNAGVNFGSVDGGALVHSVVGNNGYTGDVSTGAFVYDSSNIIIRNNEFYGMKDYTTDGNGISLDFGSDHCIVEGNYTHDNGGAGILLVGLNKPGLPANTHNIVRYNISENDGQMPGYEFGAISAYRGVSYAQIYNNTVYNTHQDAFQIWDWKGRSIHVRNNVFITDGGANNWLVNVFPPSDPSQKLQDLDLVFQGNNYYASGGSLNIRYGDGYYFSLNAWRNATGQEKLFGLPVGSIANPLLVNPGGGGTIGDPNLLVNLTAYQLQPRSRLRNMGLDLGALFGLDIGDWDFYKNTLPSGLKIAVGAHDPAEGPGAIGGGLFPFQPTLTDDAAGLPGQVIGSKVDKSPPRQSENDLSDPALMDGDRQATAGGHLRPIVPRRVHDSVSTVQAVDVDIFG
jgi:hypothetical protein